MLVSLFSFLILILVAFRLETPPVSCNCLAYAIKSRTEFSYMRCCLHAPVVSLFRFVCILLYLFVFTQCLREQILLNIAKVCQDQFRGCPTSGSALHLPMNKKKNHRPGRQPENFLAEEDVWFLDHPSPIQFIFHTLLACFPLVVVVCPVLHQHEVAIPTIVQ